MGSDLLSCLQASELTETKHVGLLQVRRSTAQLLYLRLLEEDSGELEQVTEVLLNTAWDDRLEEAQQAQNMISQNLIPDA